MKLKSASLTSLVLSVAIVLANPSANAQIFFTNQTSSTVNNLLSITFADASAGYACGDAGTIVKTSNGGTIWTPLTSGTIENLWDIKALPGSSGQKVIAVGDNNTVRKSVNGGTAWTALAIPFAPGSFVFGIHVIDTLNFYLCGGDFTTFSGAILKTNNGGSSWTLTAIPTSVFLDKIMFANSNYGYTVGTNTSFSDGSIHRTTNGGASWSLVKTSVSIITNLWCISQDTVIAVGLTGQIWRTTNAGSTWTSHSFNSTDLYGVVFYDKQNGFATGSNGLILKTNDAGITWTQIPYSFPGTIQSVCIPNPGIFIAGDLGRIAKATLPPTGINDFTFENTAFGIYPNPVNSVLYLFLKNSEKIIVTNTCGEIILQKNGDGKVELDVSFFPAGIYFIKAGNEVRKFVKE
ncbi:MAG TPA: YCF48-related protein [Bacteroidia bacterium]|nr:YCF48-related protein [Bacteroidia bacterium]